MEHDWVAETGSYVFEPPGETHTLVVPEDCAEMITLFHITGVMVYVDPWGKQTGYEDVFTKIEMCPEALQRSWARGEISWTNSFARNYPRGA